MNLQPVPYGDDPCASSAKIKILCKHCETMKPVQEMFADLNGKAFEAYYCKDCVKQFQNIFFDRS